ncbi:MAG: hypothetical protein HZY74_08000 [Brevundimonas sp.]|nr:MAG: hypothetical protein HZY74_08000 [Brevundimonas sp.]
MSFDFLLKRSRIDGLPFDGRNIGSQCVSVRSQAGNLTEDDRVVRHGLGDCRKIAKGWIAQLG